MGRPRRLPSLLPRSPLGSCRRGARRRPRAQPVRRTSDSRRRDTLLSRSLCPTRERSGRTRRLGRGSGRSSRGVAGRLKTPELKGQRSCRWLEQHREKEIIGAEAHALLSQLRSVVLSERPDLRLDRLALQDPERPHQLASQITNDLRSFLNALEREQRRKKASCRCRDPKLNSCLYRLSRARPAGIHRRRSRRSG